MTRSIKIGLFLIAILGLLIFFTNVILSNVITKIVDNQIDQINKKGEVVVTIDKIKIDIFTSNLFFKGLKVKPDSLFFEKFKQGRTTKATTSDFYLSELKMKGFNFFDILLSKEILIKDITASEMDLNVFKSDSFIKSPSKTEKVKRKSFDSIYIKGVEQIDLSKIHFDDFHIEIFDVQKRDTLFRYQGNALDLSGISLQNYEGAKNYFRFNKDSLKILLKNQQLDLEEGNYSLGIEGIEFDYPNKTVKISNIAFKPSMDRAALAATYRFNKEVYDIAATEISFNGFYLDSVVRHGLIALDSLVVDGLTFGVYKDQTKPFDLKKRPKFLNQKLKNLEQPVFVRLVKIRNSSLSYRQRQQNSKDLMAIDITEINAKVTYLTSVKDSATSDKQITAHIKGKLNNVADLNVDIFMPYNSWNNAYTITGSIGPAQLNQFNSATFPAAGLKIENGRLNSIQFSIKGTPDGTNGRMSMLYADLKGSLTLDEKERKAVSWIANSILVESNPSDKGKLRIAVIEAERVPYKGFANLLWKSVMSGMINTVNPLGKTVKNGAQYQDKMDKKKRKK